MDQAKLWNRTIRHVERSESHEMLGATQNLHKTKGHKIVKTENQSHRLNKQNEMPTKFFVHVTSPTVPHSNVGDESLLKSGEHVYTSKNKTKFKRARKGAQHSANKTKLETIILQE
jgi:hypothetical protein